MIQLVNLQPSKSKIVDISEKDNPDIYIYMNRHLAHLVCTYFDK